MLRQSMSICRSVVVAAAIGIVIVPLASAASRAQHHERPKRAARDTVESLEEQWRLAELNGDVAAMDGLLSDDFVGITAAGQVTTKAQQLARIRDRAVVLTQLDLSDTKVKLIGPIVAVVTSTAAIQGTVDGNPLMGSFRYTRVYQRLTNGAWKITSLEATRALGEGGGRMRPHPERDTPPIAQP